MRGGLVDRLTELRRRQLSDVLPESLGVDIAVPVSIDAGADLCGWHSADFCEPPDHELYELGVGVDEGEGVGCLGALTAVKDKPDGEEGIRIELRERFFSQSLCFPQSLHGGHVVRKCSLLASRMAAHASLLDESLLLFGCESDIFQPSVKGTLGHRTDPLSNLGIRVTLLAQLAREIPFMDS